MTPQIKNPRPVQSLMLFEMTNSILDGRFVTKEKKSETTGKVTGITLTIQSRKDVAKELGLKQKSQTVTDELLKASDNMKGAMLRETAAIVASQDWTGAGVRVSVAKNGQRKATFTYKTVERGPSISREQFVRSLATMTPEEQAALLEEARAQQAEANAVDVPQIDDTKANVQTTEEGKTLVEA